jgi:hypothetical protein
VSFDNPQLPGTQKDVAWNAYQTAFGALTFPDGGTLQVDRSKFELWWQSVATQRWVDVRSLMIVAWTAGTNARAEAVADAFDTWWQQIVNAQLQEEVTKVPC